VEEIFATTLTTKFHQCVTRAVSPRTCGDFLRQLDEEEPDDNKEPRARGRALPVREAVATQEAVEAAAAEEDSDSNNMPRTFPSMTTIVLFM
jgi:hypothetical protein